MNAFFSLESNESLSLWNKCDWIAVKLFLEGISLTLSVVVDEVSDVAIRHVDLIELCEDSPLEAPVLVPLGNHQRVVLVVDPHIFFKLTISIGDELAIDVGYLRNFFIESVHLILEHCILKLEGVTHVRVSGQGVNAQEELAVCVLALGNWDVYLQRILISITLHAQRSILLFYSQKVIHVIETLQPWLSHVLHVELIVVVNEEHVRERHSHILV